MVKVLVLFYSTYGHIFKMAQAAAEGARMIPNAQVALKRVPETLSNDILEKMGALEAQKQWQDVPVATPSELPEYDVILFGTPTRFGNASGQMRTFIDACGSLWVKNALVGKVASMFCSSNTQHGGQESTILTTIPTLLHLGFIYVGLPYSCVQQNGLDEIKGGSPYGSSTIAGSKGERLPSEQELEMVRFQGRNAADLGYRLSQTPPTQK